PSVENNENPTNPDRTILFATAATVATRHNSSAPSTTAIWLLSTSRSHGLKFKTRMPSSGVVPGGNFAASNGGMMSGIMSNGDESRTSQLPVQRHILMVFAALLVPWV